MSKILDYPFTQEDAQRAYDQWGCNCGPSALAFALQVPLEHVRWHIPDFDRKRYTSPTMMKAALESLGVKWLNMKPNSLKLFTKNVMFADRVSLVRVQWTGPWTAPGANPRWAYGHTHWIATYIDASKARHFGRLQTVFDCNGGIRSLDSWEREIVPLLTNYPRADGGWEITHVWRLL